ncbi:MAG: hypothetical protein ACRDSQ_25800, partial [Actinokineospora sp.]
MCDISPAAAASGNAPDEQTPLRRHAKTLRHLFFCVPGRIVRTARRIIVRLPEGLPHFDHFNATYHAARARVLDAAYQANPERFVRRAPTPPQGPVAAWINKPDSEDLT